MALRVALVTPFAWSQPHDVNEHVAGLSRELRAARSQRDRPWLLRIEHAISPRAGEAPRHGARGRLRRARAGKCRSRGGAGWASPVGRAPRTWPSLWERAASTSCTASSRACRASPTSRFRDARRADRRDVSSPRSVCRTRPRAAHAPRAVARPARRAACDERGGRRRPRPSASPAAMSSSHSVST